MQRSIERGSLNPIIISLIISILFILYSRYVTSAMFFPRPREHWRLGFTAISQDIVKRFFLYLFLYWVGVLVYTYFISHLNRKGFLRQLATGLIVGLIVNIYLFLLELELIERFESYETQSIYRLYFFLFYFVSLALLSLGASWVAVSTWIGLRRDDSSLILNPLRLNSAFYYPIPVLWILILILYLFKQRLIFPVWMLFIFLLSSAIFYDRLRGGSIGEAIFGYARSLYRKIYSFLRIRRNFLLVVLLISLLLRGFFAFKSSSTPLGYGGTDCQTYVGIAMRKADRNIDELRPVDEGARRVYNTLAKKEVIPWPAPGYYYYLSLVFKIFGPNFLVVELIQAFWGGLVCLGVYYIGSKIFGETVGRIAALMTALSGMLTNYAIYVASEGIYIPLLSLALVLLIRPMEKRKFLNYILVGLALGLAIITRPVIFYFIPVIILWVLISSASRKKVLPGIKYSLVLLLMIFLAMLPLTIRNYIYLNRFTLFTSFYESEDFFWRLYDPEEVGKYYKPAEGDPQNIEELRASDIRVIKAFISYIFHNAYSFGRAYWKRFVNFWMGYDVVNFDHIFLYTGSKYSYAMRLYFYAFAIYGLILSLKEWRHNWQEKLLLYLLIAYYVIFHIVIYVSTRHRAPIQPYIIIFAAYGIYYLLRNWDFVRSKKLETSA